MPLVLEGGGFGGHGVALSQVMSYGGVDAEYRGRRKRKLKYGEAMSEGSSDKSDSDSSKDQDGEGGEKQEGMDQITLILIIILSVITVFVLLVLLECGCAFYNAAKLKRQKYEQEMKAAMEEAMKGGSQADDEEDETKKLMGNNME